MKSTGTQSIARYMRGTRKSAVEFWRRFRKNRAGVLGLCVVAFFTVIGLLAPVISPHDPYKINLYEAGLIYAPPSNQYPLGTDQFGRDVLSRMLWGSRISLFIGFVSAGIAVVIGSALGSLAGYYGGRVDEILMRIVDIFLTIPTFFLILLIVAVFGASIWNVMIVIGLTIWPGTARLVRAEFLSFKQEPFVEAATVAGAGDFHIMFREILPNAIFPAIVNASMQVGSAIMTESSLSFLGLGDPNQVSWGWMLNDAMRSFRRAVWLTVFPGIAITLSVIAFNLIGDALNDALNPHLKER